MPQFVATQKSWWIASDPVCHYGDLDPGNQISTGQENLHIYDTEAEWLAALAAHGVDDPFAEDAEPEPEDDDETDMEAPKP